jgi:hypothetical protein
MIDKYDIAFQKGYKAAQKDTIAIMCDSLWKHVKSLQKGFPELAEGISFAIEIIEKEFSKELLAELDRDHKRSTKLKKEN